MSDLPTVQRDGDETVSKVTETGEDSRLSERRRILKAGVVAPVILTIVSQPAFGQGTTCFSPSRSLSKNTSLSQHGQYGSCDGVSPGSYAQQADSSSPACRWPCDPNTSFNQVFDDPNHTYYTKDCQKWNTNEMGNQKTCQAWSLPRSMTLLEVLNLQGNQDPSKIAFHVVGAYLNILNGYIPNAVLNVASLKSMWHDYVTYGYYSPTANVKWYAPDIVTYLQQYYIAP